MKVLLVNSPLTFEPVQETEDYLPPIGLMCLKSTLIEHGNDVAIYDTFLKKESFSNIVDYINDYNADFIGLNMFAVNYNTVKVIVESYTGSGKIILGGPCIESIYQDVNEWNIKSRINVVIGEGDHIIVDIVNDCISEEPVYKSDKIIAYRVNSESKYYPKNINDIVVDYTDGLRLVNNPYGLEECSIVTSRGCIYNCAFCGAARDLNVKTEVRRKSKEAISKEIHSIKDKNDHVQSIRVLDDLFLLNDESIDTAIEIFNEAKMKWRAMAHAVTFKNSTTSKLLDLKESGCIELFVGIESGSSKMRKFINKAGSVETVAESITKLLKAGINVKGYFIFGFPDETENDMIDTYKLASEILKISQKTLGDFRVSVFKFRPYPGTKLYNYVFEESDIKPDYLVDLNLVRCSMRKEFSMVSGNYSSCSDEILMKYITLTNSLSNKLVR